MKKIYIIILIALSTNLFAQNTDADKLLNDVKTKFEKVNDYKVNVNIKLDISFAKVPDTKATIYFKKPDKVKFESEGFAMIPKESINFSPAQLLHGDYTAIYTKSENIDGKNLAVIKIIPNSDSTNFILTTMWIDPQYSLIRKVVINARRGGATTITFDYDNTEYSLPSKLLFSFDVGNVEVPEQMQQNPTQNNQRNRGRFRNMKLSGTVIVTYSNYVINKGIPDSVFEEKKK